MTAQLVLHIGDCKSGSTAIQSVLQLGSWRFEGADAPSLEYAKGGRRDGLNHHRLSDSLHLERAQEYREQAWSNLGKEFRATPADRLVVSSERFEFAPPEAVHAALEEFVPEALSDMRVIAYVRPHVARLISGFAQNVKQGLHEGDLPGFLAQMREEGRFLYADRLLGWQRVFGTRLELRPMMRERLTGGCVVQDFLTFCGAPTGVSAVVEKIPMANGSLNPAGLAFLAELRTTLKRRNPAPNPQRQQLLQRLATQLEALPAFSEGRVSLPEEMRDDVRAAFAEDAARCDAELFGAPVFVPELERALAAPPEPPAPGAEIETRRLTDLSLVWMDMMQAMQQQMQRAAQGGGGNGRPGQGGGQGQGGGGMRRRPRPN